jgi:bis(5'-nucleosyl)-tetraphosphatase (symmetrical)
MATYAIGDIQGCFKTLENLLKVIDFDADKDSLWFAGDLVNRGPQSLETLRFVKALGARHHTVLGNHDLHLLAVSYNAHGGRADDTLQPILNAPDREELLDWLRHQPLMYAAQDYVMVHAGLAASWDLDKAQALAHEVEMAISGASAAEFFQNMYGNLPDQWSDELTGWDRLRCITNFFTRARFCYADGRLDLKFKGTLEDYPANLMPWFQVPERKSQNLKILFGHWAALGGVTNTPNTYALDTGCVWGFKLTAQRLEDGQRFQSPFVK